MRHTGVLALYLLVGFLPVLPGLAETTQELTLDKQVDLNLPQKSDPLTKKKPEPEPEPKKVTPPVSYDGIWLVTLADNECKNRISDFKIKVSGEDITTVVGMNVQGNANSDGSFEMNAKTQYWVIKFNGKLLEKAGNGRWLKIDTGNKTCSGTFSLERQDK